MYTYLHGNGHPCVSARRVVSHTMSRYPHGNGHLSGVEWRAFSHTIPPGHLWDWGGGGWGVGDGQLLTPCQQIHMVMVKVTSLGVGGGGCYSRTIMKHIST